LGSAIKRSNTPRTIKAIDVYSRKNRREIYAFNSGFLLNPASNLKIVTTSFALSSLGTDYRFKTRFVSTGVRSHDTINGDLVVIACGDPLITHDDLDSIARIISGKGIKSISGRLVIDVSKFDSVEWGSGWMWDDEPDQYQMFISPACIDHNTIMVHVSVDSSGRKLIVTTTPVTGFVRVVSTAVQDMVDSLYVTRVMAGDTNTISVSGTYPANLPTRQHKFSLRYPAEYFGTVFKEALDRNGIRVQGHMVVDSRLEKPTTPAKIDTLLMFEDSIDTVVTFVDKISDNLGAECLLREAASEIDGTAGSATRGISMECNFLQQCGVDSNEYCIADACGLSRYNLITPDAIVKVLDHDLSQPYASLFMHSLPLSGNDGTLEKRLDQDITAGRVYAKTGSINGVSTLSGFVLLPQDTLVFSMMMQNFIGSGDSIRALQDSLCTILALYNDKPREFASNLKRHHVGTYWEVYRRNEMRKHERNRLVRMKSRPIESRKDSSH
jgi:PBP4 family serine-type D-alanyl-D-alanine carboxypeptidase